MSDILRQSFRRKGSAIILALFNIVSIALGEARFAARLVRDSATRQVPPRVSVFNCSAIESSRYNEHVALIKKSRNQN